MKRASDRNGRAALVLDCNFHVQAVTAQRDTARRHELMRPYFHSRFRRPQHQRDTARAVISLAGGKLPVSRAKESVGWQGASVAKLRETQRDSASYGLARRKVGLAAEEQSLNVVAAPVARDMSALQIHGGAAAAGVCQQHGFLTAAARDGLDRAGPQAPDLQQQSGSGRVVLALEGAGSLQKIRQYFLCKYLMNMSKQYG